MKELKVFRWMNLVFGILEIALGIWYLCQPQGGSLTIAYIIPFAIMCSGLSTLMYYFATGRYVLGSGWILVDGLISVLFSLLVLTSGVFAIFAGVVPYLFGLWAIVGGLHLAVSSHDIKLLGTKYWWIALVMGLVGIVLGVLCFWNPTLGDEVIGVFIGLYFILMGVAGVLEFTYSTKLKNRIKKVYNDVTHKYSYKIEDEPTVSLDASDVFRDENDKNDN